MALQDEVINEHFDYYGSFGLDNNDLPFYEELSNAFNECDLTLYKIH